MHTEKYPPKRGKNKRKRLKRTVLKEVVGSWSCLELKVEFDN